MVWNLGSLNEVVIILDVKKHNATSELEQQGVIQQVRCLDPFRVQLSLSLIKTHTNMAVTKCVKFCTLSTIHQCALQYLTPYSICQNVRKKKSKCVNTYQCVQYLNTEMNRLVSWTANIKKQNRHLFWLTSLDEEGKLNPPSRFL